MSNNKPILVGKIVAPQGIRGEVRVQTYTDEPSDFKDLTVFGRSVLGGGFHFVRALPNTNVVIARIDGISDRNMAEQLRGTELFINRDDLPELTQDGEYYQSDLIGLSVVRHGIVLGTVACFQNFGAGDIIELDNGEMVSFRGAEVNLDKKIISVK